MLKMTFDYKSDDGDLEKIKKFLIQTPEIINCLNNPESSNFLKVCTQQFEEETFSAYNGL